MSKAKSAVFQDPMFHNEDKAREALEAVRWPEGAICPHCGNSDQDKLAKHMHEASFDTIVGKIKFGEDGEWAGPRILTIQYQNIEGHGMEQFTEPGHQVILYPPDLKSGELRYPYSDLKR